MLFQSFTFLLGFLPVAFVGFWVLSRFGGSRAVLGWIILCSFVFYAWDRPEYLVLLAGSIVINFLIAHALEKTRSPKLILTLGVGANLLVLGYYKYAGFFFSIQNIVLPLAISFFTFQQIAFLVQAYRGKAKGASFLGYAASISFFPHLIAGPIVQPRDLLPQMESLPPDEPVSRRVAVGITYFALGLFKKVVIADRIEPYASQVFTLAHQGADISFLLAWAGAFAFAFQIYFDFSAYSEMAVGLGRMFGIRLPVNFDAPYRSRSITEFWRRWHITLSAFFREYVYIPLGGSRGGMTATLRNLMLTMLLSGLWHGAGWAFILWGGVHGLAMCVERLWAALGLKKLPSSLAWALAFLFTTSTWVLFRAGDLGDAVSIFRGMAGVNGVMPPSSDIAFWNPWWIENGVLQSFHFTPLILLAPLAAVFFVHCVPTVEEFMRPADGNDDPLHHTKTESRFGRIFAWRPSIAYGVRTAALLLMSLHAMLIASPAPFLYFKF